MAFIEWVDAPQVVEEPVAEEKGKKRKGAKPAADTEAKGGAAARWLLWSPVIALIVGAVAVPGGLVFLLLPLLGIGYSIFALIAWLGPDDPISRKETP